jgi:serine/threonine protein kinase
MSRLYSIDLPQTRLRQLCGSDALFRDRYQILQSLGRGGFGVTYLAKDVLLPSAPECVIKQLCPKTDNPQVLRRASERFEREAKTLGQLGSHAQIPQLLDYFEESGEFFLVQEYVRGCNLAKLVKTHGLVSEVGVKRFLAELLPVLEFIHRNQVIHRDIKPPNIIRCEDDGRLVLIDFGAVKEKIAEITTDFGQKAPTTQFVGTVGFAPPEQLALRPIYGSDLYALGMTCLYLMTGRTPMEFEVNPRTGEVKWQNDVDVSQHFSHILDKMLKPAPRDRYHAASEIVRALELEPYLDNLATCMNSKSRPAETDEPDDSPTYLTPIARTAKDIRSWRARMAARQKGDGPTSPKESRWRAQNISLNSSCCG